MLKDRELLSCEVTGSGPTIIFLHGLTYDRRIWKPVIELLSSTFTCVAVDLPGHGESPDLGPYDLNSIAACAKRSVDRFHSDSPIIVGNSIGACVAAVYAAQYGAEALVLAEHLLEFAPLARSLKAVEQKLRGAEFLEICGVIESGFRIEHLGETNRQLVRNSSRQRQEIVLAYWDWLLSAADPEDIDRRFRPTLDAIRCPLLSIHGSNPGKEYDEWLLERVTHAKLEVWDNAGHFPHLMHPERFAEAVRQTAKLRPL